MSNWIEGTMKLRGNAENIRRFIKNGLEPLSERNYLGKKYTYEDLVDLDLYGEDDCIDIVIKNTMWIRNTM